MNRPTREQNKALREFFLNSLEEHKGDIARVTAEKFDVSRVTIHRHIQALIKEGLLTASGNTKARTYKLATLVSESFQVPTEGLEEDVIWRKAMLPLIQRGPENIVDICQWGFTEMLNNAVDHSGAEFVELRVCITAVDILLTVSDEGIGIFRKIQKDHNLHDPRHALLELSKGKLTSDEASHSGEGIFFTSRMFDKFMISSGELAFCRFNKDHGDWLLQVEDTDYRQGTEIYMKIRKSAQQTTQGICNQFALPSGEFDFSKTHVPIKLAVYEGEKLISRSQAKRLLARVENFKEVLLDFEGVETIGQAFADEIFRVFTREHAEVSIVPIGARSQVQGMITRVRFDEATPLLFDT